ncbi:MAG: TPM domain-containing protein [Bacteroidales bacterium]|nr:TPM domain-containing protein [Bacteroidales bacterium]
MKYFFALLLAQIFILCSFANEYTVSTVPNPKNSDADAFVSNPDGILSDTMTYRLNLLARKIKNTTDVELAVVALDAIGSNYYDEFEFGLELFNTWGVGDARKNTGVMLLLVKDTRWFYIHTGDGIEGILSDATCSNILQEKVYPLLKNGDWDNGIYACAEGIYEKINTQEAKEELLSDFTPAKPKYTGLMNYLAISFLILLIFMFFADKALNWNKDATNSIRYQHTRKLYVWGVVFAVLFPAAMTFFTWWFKKMRNGIRQQTVKCPQCGHDMKLLSEQEEDAILNSKQQSEENVKSIDYDVWLCPECQHSIIYPYNNATSKYTVCSCCGAKTYGLLSDVVTSRASTYSAGEGVKTYKCRHCGKTDKKTYIIPRLTTSGGGGFGSSGGGGSWGGGHSGGGGAGGRF